MTAHNLYSSRTSDSLESITPDPERPAILCSFVEDLWQFDYFHHAAGNCNLIVFFPGAMVRGKRHVPCFHRWTWATHLHNTDVLCVSDPTLRLDNEILGAWFQGYKEDWVLLRILQHIRYLKNKFKYQRVIFCGSSMGGFVALQAGILAPSTSEDAEKYLVFAENPQVCLPRYKFTAPMVKLAQVSFGVDDINAIPEKAMVRLDTVALMQQHNYAPRGLVVVKESDKHHHQVHVQYLRDNISPNQAQRLKIEVIPEAIDATGHTPLSFHEMSARLVKLMI